MPRRHKEYRVELAPDALAETPAALEVRFTDEWGKTGRLFDFRPLARRQPLASEFALAFRHYALSKTVQTQCGTYEAVMRWFEFLDETRSPVQRVRDIDVTVLRFYLAWLQTTVRAKATRAGRYGCVKRLLSWLQRYRPDLTSDQLEFPYNAFPRSQSDCAPRDPLSKREIEAVLAAARKEIDADWQRFEHGRALSGAVDKRTLSAASTMADSAEHDLGTVLAIICHRFDGVVPRKADILKTRGGHALYRAIELHGGSFHVSSYLHATSKTLLPYLLIIGASLFANPVALRGMRRDCMVDHVLLEGRSVVTWVKGRARRPQRRSFMRGKAHSIPMLIDQVLALTGPLVRHVHPRFQNLLFLCRKPKSDPQLCGAFPHETSTVLNNFVKRHGLVADNGKPLKLVLASLRVTGLGLAHVSLGRDILKTQLIANHEQPTTTVRYIDRPASRSANAAVINDLQAQFVESVRKGVLSHISRSSVSFRMRPDNISASGFVCRDPTEGVAPGQKPGSMCTAWLGCFTCPNAVIPTNADVLARLLAMREALFEARDSLPPARWSEVYAAKLEILERDLLPRFSAKLFDDAMRLLPTTFHPPKLE